MTPTSHPRPPRPSPPARNRPRISNVKQKHSQRNSPGPLPRRDTSRRHATDKNLHSPARSTEPPYRPDPIPTRTQPRQPRRYRKVSRASVTAAAATAAYPPADHHLRDPPADHRQPLPRPHRTHPPQPAHRVRPPDQHTATLPSAMPLPVRNRQHHHGTRATVRDQPARIPRRHRYSSRQHHTPNPQTGTHQPASRHPNRHHTTNPQKATDHQQQPHNQQPLTTTATNPRHRTQLAHSQS